MMAQFALENDSVLTQFVKQSLQTTEFSIYPLAGDASSRRYYRATAGDDSWVIMRWDPVTDPEKYPFISIQKHLMEHKIDVPTIRNADYTTGLYLLEDLGDLTLERKFWENQYQENVLPFYKVTIDKLAILHRLSLNDKNKSQCTAYKVRFDTEKFKWELNYTLTYLFKTFLNQSIKNEDQLQAEFEQLSKTLADAPAVLTHRDFHSRNLMIKNNKIYFIDFQDARMGPPQYDLVSLLHDSYVRLSAESKSVLLDYYLQMFPEALTMYSTQQNFMHFYQLQTLQRCFKACGTFAAIHAQRGDNRYLKYLPHTLQTVQQTIASLEGFPLLKDLVVSAVLPDIEV